MFIVGTQLTRIALFFSIPLYIASSWRYIFTFVHMYVHFILYLPGYYMKRRFYVQIYFIHSEYIKTSRGQPLHWWSFFLGQAGGIFEIKLELLKLIFFSDWNGVESLELNSGKEIVATNIQPVITPFVEHRYHCVSLYPIAVNVCTTCTPSILYIVGVHSRNYLLKKF